MVLRQQQQQQSGVPLTVLFITLCLCAFVNAYVIKDDMCTDLNTATCTCYNGGEFELECTKKNISIKLEVILQRVDIECNYNNDRRIYTYLPDLKLSNMSSGPGIDQVKFKYCPLPEGTTIKGVIVDKLGIDRVQTLTFSSKSDMQMRREQLIGLTSLRSLRFNGPISDLSEDAFNGVPNITALELRSTNVHLPLNIFKNLSELEFLELGSNGLNDLASGIFSNQRKLKRLNLWANNLRNLTKDSFIGATSVTDLDLSSNNIEMFQPDIFEHFKDLENINLGTNRFIELPVGLFSTNKKLMRIRLMYNRVDLKTLPNGLLANLPQLQEVMIRCNLQFLPGDLLNGSTQIENVTLSSNKLTTLPAEFFSTQTDMVNLDLSDNQLTELPEIFFNTNKKLKKITLSNNNLTKISG
ncbi:protein toll-like, partial [Contarinia nasturtii]|uniref:protein toll-like n=1 Tax=Contarinia nasturtii TaxID=265458 RepID=UPI0012D3DB5A